MMIQTHSERENWQKWEREKQFGTHLFIFRSMQKGEDQTSSSARRQTSFSHPFTRRERRKKQTHIYNRLMMSQFDVWWVKLWQSQMIHTSSSSLLLTYYLLEERRKKSTSHTHILAVKQLIKSSVRMRLICVRVCVCNVYVIIIVHNACKTAVVKTAHIIILLVLSSLVVVVLITWYKRFLSVLHSCYFKWLVIFFHSFNLVTVLLLLLFHLHAILHIWTCSNWNWNSNLLLMNSIYMYTVYCTVSRQNNT